MTGSPQPQANRPSVIEGPTTKVSRSTSWLRNLSRTNLATLILLYITALHVIGLYIFTKGFLLTRLTIPHVSPPYTPENLAPVPATHSKAVIIIIDALRTDFISPHYPQQKSPYHHGVLTLPSELSLSQPDHSLIFNSFSDPPTSTMQRIKGITTGSLPTFIDISSNFASTAIEEDSLISQLLAHNKTLGFMGDDTWVNLFPDSFDLSHPYDSFNVEDLHSVDDGVVEHIFPYLVPANQSKWDVLIGHFLGVDHVGHRVGPNRDTMRSKLAQMDRVLRRVVEMLDDQTLLVVLGDHGMDDKGNHGGDAELETSSAMWLYSKSTPLKAARKLDKTITETWPEYTFPGSETPLRHINQIDIVPTLSLLLGVPIPYNNLGSVIPECFSRDLKVLEAATRNNAEQIDRYLEAYGDESLKQSLKTAWDKARATVDSTNSPEKSINTHRHYALLALRHLRALWAQFSLPLILVGSLILGLSAFTLVALYVGVRNNGINWDVYARLALETSFTASGIAGSIVGTLAGIYTANPLTAIKVFITTAAIISEIIIIFPLFLKVSIPQSFNINRSIGPLLLVAHSLSFASNSFIMWEDRVVLFLLTTIPIIYLIKALSAPTAEMRLRIIGLSLALIVVIRLVATVTVCREEQQPYCRVTFFSGSTPVAPRWVVLATIPLALNILPRAIGITLTRSKSLAGPAPFFLGYLFRGVLLSNAIYWGLEYLETNSESIGLSESALTTANFLKLWIARFSIGTILGALPYIWFISPLCIKIGEKIINQENNKEEVKILGFANSFGSTYLLFLLIPFCLIHLTNQPMGQLTLSLLLISILIYLELIDTRRDEIILKNQFSLSNSPGSFDENELNSNSIIVKPIFTNLIPLILIGFLGFFSTGHQAVFQTIQWKSAFIGFNFVQYPFSPFFLILNTFGFFIISSFSIPLLSFWNISPKPFLKIPLINHNLQFFLGFLIYHNFITFSNCLFSSYLRRHLMVWKVFAPRFMLSGITLLIIDFSCLLALTIGVRVTAWKVKKTFGCDSI
ncbi:uncharacterized protein I206_102695 [Kwoniella pini CBS 10737]|uniref:Phosphatidylinositol glycan, class O n=1 Tax=Kwoniella pini CBS 10737 TaxID=1296096 RepID=A0A1B9I634_9TREE|nr:phosphatidylinositol glycan, class O [Kwoniella pini CBS 10737]OCF50986.1 phosphatidylinositol glycan, class O [Kwoniella pini CBS 10737]